MSIVPTTDLGRRTTRSPALLIGLVAGAIGAVVLLAFLVLSGDGDPAPSAAPAPVVATPAQAEAEDDPAEPPVVEALPVITYDVFLSRDPFEPVVPEPEPDTPPGDPTDPTSPTTPATPPDPTAPGGPTDPSTPPAPTDPSDPMDPSRPGTLPPTGSPPADGAPAHVTLLELGRGTEGELRAAIQVRDTVYDVAVGEVFADSYRVVEFLGEGCVSLQVGDVVRRLCVGGTLK